MIGCMAVLLGLLTLVSCYNYDDPERLVTTQDYLYVSISLDLPFQQQPTRSNPNGGENGDGSQAAELRESNVSGITVVVMNNDRSSILAVEYFSASQLQEVTPAADTDVPNADRTYDLKIPVEGAKGNANIFSFVVIANKDLTGTINTSTTPTTLYNTIVDAAWTGTGTNCTNFVMSNEEFVNHTYDSGAGTATNPLRLHVRLERLAARIDFDRTGSTVDDGALKYPINNSSNQNIANLYLTDIQLVNCAKEPSYLLKRVATTIGGDITYLGTETADGNNVPTNYVIEPHSADKNGNVNTTFLTACYADGTMNAVSTTASTFILGYTNENTFAADKTCKEYCTGLLMKGTYVPVTLYSAYDSSTDALTTADSYTKGTTFYRYWPDAASAGEEAAKYFTTEAAATAYASNPAHPGTVTTYTDGVCYYYIWIRHGNNNVDASYGIMEYAIVRNNIYRVSIETATGIGANTPTPRDPEKLKTKIYVRKWREVSHPAINI